jgi:hypothetical protein
LISPSSSSLCFSTITAIAAMAASPSNSGSAPMPPPTAAGATATAGAARKRPAAAAAASDDRQHATGARSRLGCSRAGRSSGLSRAGCANGSPRFGRSENAEGNERVDRTRRCSRSRAGHQWTLLRKPRCNYGSSATPSLLGSTHPPNAAVSCTGMNKTQVTRRVSVRYALFSRSVAGGCTGRTPPFSAMVCGAVPAPAFADGLARIVEQPKRDSSIMEHILHFGVSGW